MSYSAGLDYPIELNGRTFYPGSDYNKYLQRKNGEHQRADWAWRWSKELFEFGYNNGFIVVKEKANGTARIYTKTYLNATIKRNINGKYEVVISERKKPLSTLDFLDAKYSNDNAKKDLKQICYSDSAIVLDCFAGSGTTGHAVMKLNAEDGGNRKFILCTNNENNICHDVTYERIKRVIDKENYTASLKYYKVDYIPISDRLYYEYADELLKHIRELVELENGVNFTGNAEIGIVLTEEELDEFMTNIEAYGKCRKLYMGHDLLPDEEQEQSLAILKSPTGSGKTIILTYFMHQYVQSYRNTVFVWLTPGKGNLEEQSKEKMDKYIHDAQTKLLSDVMTGGFEENDNCFINWEKLTKKGNNALKDSEHTNFLEHIEHALYAGLHFIVIVDESHQNNTVKADEIIQYFHTDKIIRCSATPKGIKNAEIIEIPEADVIAEGLIKKMLIINEDFPQRVEMENATNYLLEQAYAKQRKIRAEFLSAGKDINPLIVETKGGFDRSGNSQDIDIFTPKKFAVLKDYLERYGLKGGIVRYDEKSEELCICMDSYSEDINSDSWVVLSDILK